MAVGLLLDRGPKSKRGPKRTCRATVFSLISSCGWMGEPWESGQATKAEVLGRQSNSFALGPQLQAIRVLVNSTAAPLARYDVLFRALGLAIDLFQRRYAFQNLANAIDIKRFHALIYGQLANLDGRLVFENHLANFGIHEH